MLGGSVVGGINAQTVPHGNVSPDKGNCNG
jgi:hypothetical protein